MKISITMVLNVDSITPGNVTPSTVAERIMKLIHTDYEFDADILSVRSGEIKEDQ